MIDRDGTIAYSEVEVVHYRAEEIIVYPNPAKELINLMYIEEAKLIYDILSVKGDLLRDGVISASDSKSIIISDLSPGVYLLRIKVGDQYRVNRFGVY